MSVEWQVLEDGLPPDIITHPPAPARRGWLLVIALSGLLLASVGGWVGWNIYQARQREQLLRQELTDHIRAETRAQLFNLEDEYERYMADFNAGEHVAWQGRYRQQFAPTDEAPLYYTLNQLFMYTPGWLPNIPREIVPAVGQVQLNDDASQVTVEVLWQGRSTTREWRVYQWQAGSWRRVPYQPDVALDAVYEENYSEHFIFRAPPDAYAEVAGGQQYLASLEKVYASLHETWPPFLVKALPDATTVQMTPTDIGPLLQVWGNSPDTYIINSPTLGFADPTLPLSAERQLELGLVNLAILEKFFYTDDEHLRELGLSFSEPDTTPIYISLLLFLPNAEAQRLLLTPAEQQAMEQMWREELVAAGGWLSPFTANAMDIQAENEFSDDLYSRQIRYLLSLRLFLNYLINERGLAPAILANALIAGSHPTPDEPTTLADRLIPLTELTQAEMEHDAQRYALGEGAP